MSDALIERVDCDRVKMEGELLPGGDIRLKGNLWVRSAYKGAGLERVPREGPVREALNRLVRKKKLRSCLRFYFSNCAT